MVPALFAGTALKLACDNPFYQLGLSCLSGLCGIGQLQPDFVSVMGLSPKEYTGMLRFNQAFRLLDECNLTEAALNAGYWDQAHMIRDFKKMSGFTPAQVRKLRPTINSF